ncbi:endo-1,3(4)-beta-glucanase [Plectosphaerella cucumerina]|uniref:glucan endo-1,3-beta-D-glucosidase n=1 Tax=Plectosphaerella cucumerina TaxID=40658 RepID=A0A8K0TV50_9PEZI|nr:endo-1,3(4)-beta-glucanase [Plectosphaerella cucumerina]
MRLNALPSCLLWVAGAQALALPIVERQDADIPTAITGTEDVIPVSKTVSVSLSVAPTGTVQILPTLSDVEPHTTGIVVTEIERTTNNYLLTASIPSPTSLLQPLKSVTKRDPEPSAHALSRRQSAGPAADIFGVPVGTSPPNTIIARRSDHPVPRKEIRKSGPIQTNKFFSNFFLDDQRGHTFTFPYAVAWAKGWAPAVSYGLAVSHTEARQRVFGPVQFNGANEYFINPIGIHSMILSAKELGKDTVLYTDLMTAFSVRVNLKVNAAATKPTVQFPISQGMGFVTGVYDGATPILQTGVFFRTMTKATTNPKTNVVKYSFLLEDGTTWRVYGYHTSGQPLDLKVTNNGLVTSTRPFYGIVQVAKDPQTGISERVLDYGCGIYSTDTTVVGSVSGSSGSYSLKFTRAGHGTGALVMFALPHHVAAFNADTKAATKDYKLQTGTKGVATAIVGNVWTMLEPSLPTGMGLAPWDASKGGSRKNLSQAAKDAIAKIAQVEISQDIIAQLDQNSMYFSGKTLLKFAQILYVLNDLVGDKALAQAGLVKLKEAFAIFASNKQAFPLVYDKGWDGLVSSASYITGNSGADFGNTYYNDHHFHYGYHILTAAYIGYLDRAWATQNAEYVNTLVRDIANPSTRDIYYAQHRTFDWYHGHSWAHGLIAQADGKNQESTSEDITAAYACKMWGTFIGDVNMVARANLQLAVMTRSMQSYYMYTKDNIHQPASFIGNKVAGILFENKIHHTTHFANGTPQIESIQGIHMIPIHAPSALQRSKTFIKEEWDTFFGNGAIDKMDNGWKGIVYANYAIIEPKKAWDFFNGTTFDSNKWLDGGASRTWYMAYSAALGGL